MNPTDPHRLESLLAGLFDEDLTQEEHRELEQMLLSDAAARDKYCEYVKAHALLTARASGLPGDDTLMTPQFAMQNAGTQEAALEAPAEKPAVSVMNVRYWRKHRVQFGAVALVLTLLLWVGFFAIFFNRDDDSDQRDPFGMPASVVAQVTDMHGVLWAEGTESFVVDDLLSQEDVLELSSGFVEIKFFDGSVVLLEGPAEFTVNTRGAGTLEHGKLVARIERQVGRSEVVPFAIFTPLAEIIDIGTEFGVVAEADGATQVDVFQGRVEARPRGAARTVHSQPLLLTQGESARIAPGEDQFNHERAGQFVRELPEQEIENVTLEIDNWRFIKMTGDPQDTGNEEIYAFPNIETTLLRFDISPFRGGRALTDLTLEMTVYEDQRKATVNLYQLRANNGDVDLDDADSGFRDASAGLSWLDLNNQPVNATLEDLTTGSVLATVEIPADQDGMTISWKIDRVHLQGWLDGTQPPILVIQGGYARFDGFLHDQGTDPPRIKFQVSLPP